MLAAGPALRHRGLLAKRFQSQRVLGALFEQIFDGPAQEFKPQIGFLRVTLMLVDNGTKRFVDNAGPGRVREPAGDPQGKAEAVEAVELSSARERGGKLVQGTDG